MVEDEEHSYHHTFLRVYDYQNPAVKFWSELTEIVKLIIVLS